MSIVVNEELKAYIDPLTPEEHEALERSLLAEGCRDALVLWGDVLIDGHNRHGICQKHGIAFQTVQHPHIKSMDDVHLWMIDQHLGRRSVSDFQRGVLALRKREILAQRRQRLAEALAAPHEGPAHEAAARAQPAGSPDLAPEPAALKHRSDIARAARLSSAQIGLIEKIQSQAVPELVDAVRQGQVSLNAAAAVASLPAAEQASAAQGGKVELKQAAKRVRQAQRQAWAERLPASPELSTASADAKSDPNPAPADELAALRQRVAALTAENAALRQELAALRACP